MGPDTVQVPTEAFRVAARLMESLSATLRLIAEGHHDEDDYPRRSIANDIDSWRQDLIQLAPSEAARLDYSSRTEWYSSLLACFRDYLGDADTDKIRAMAPGGDPTKR